MRNRKKSRKILKNPFRKEKKMGLEIDESDFSDEESESEVEDLDFDTDMMPDLSHLSERQQKQFLDGLDMLELHEWRKSATTHQNMELVSQIDQAATAKSAAEIRPWLEKMMNKSKNLDIEDLYLLHKMAEGKKGKQFAAARNRVENEINNLDVPGLGKLKNHAEKVGDAAFAAAVSRLAEKKMYVTEQAASVDKRSDKGKERSDAVSTQGFFSSQGQSQPSRVKDRIRQFEDLAQKNATQETQKIHRK